MTNSAAQPARTLAGKVALVTGGAGGIGSATARRLATSGATIAIADFNEAGAGALARELNANGGRAIDVQVDVANPASVDEMVRRVLEQLGQIDVLVNAAGVQGRSRPVWETDYEEWRRVLTIDLDSVFLVSRAVIPSMLERRTGRIISISSNRGKDVAPGLSHYCTAKAGIIALTKVLGKELAPHGILVHAISPGPIDTAMSRSPDAGDWDAMLASIPLGRMGQPEEVADLVELLATDRIAFSTGFTWDLSGGRAVY